MTIDPTRSPRSPLSADSATAASRAWGGLRWYLREFTGEARWDAYLESCASHGHPPISRREFERRRSQLAEDSVRMRCC